MYDASALNNAERVVIKIGSALLVDAKTDTVNASFIEGIAADVAHLKQRGASVVIVSSGAVALGRRRLGLKRRALKLAEKQAAAAVGQVILAHAWREALETYQLKTAQILLSPDDTETRRKHLNARATFSALLTLDAIPIVNENDTVSTAEICFGDNDRLAARVAAMISADLLILLSDIDGLYTSNPRRDPAATHLSQVTQVTPEIMSMAGQANTADASGGMVTKLEAARIATTAGCQMIICDGQAARPLARLERGARHTRFLASESPYSARQRWIAGALTPKGTIVVDAGAALAIQEGRSLLPAGVIAIRGRFERGDLVRIEGAEDEVIGHGLSSYHSEDAALICGYQSHEVSTLLGARARDEMIHADNLVLREL